MVGKNDTLHCIFDMDRVKRIWYLLPMRAAKVQASLRIRAVSPEPPLLAHTSSESRGTFSQKARSLAPLNGWACAVKICHDGMLEDTNSLDGAHIIKFSWSKQILYDYCYITVLWYCADPAIFIAFQKNIKRFSYLPTLKCFRKLDEKLKKCQNCKINA